MWFPPGAGAALNRSAWIVNMCADADEYSNALGWLAGLDAARTVPIFNHPKSILETRRDTIADRLGGIEGLIVPKCLRFTPEMPPDFQTAFREGGFHYPVLLRPTSSQTGQNLLKIDSADDWDQIYKIPWPGQTMFMTQFVDFAEAQGSYIKIRIAMVGRTHMVRHIKFDAGWKVHNTEDAASYVQRELELIEHLEGSATLHRIVQEVQRRIPLDFWGLDLGYAGDGKDLVFFEGNAAMSMVFDERPNRGQSSHGGRREGLLRKKAIGDGLKKQLQEHLRSPSEWLRPA